MSRAVAVALIVVAAATWGTVGAVQELALSTGAPAAVGAVRCLVGGLLLAAVAAHRRGRAPAAAWGPLAVAVVSMAVFQAGYLGGIRATGVAVGTLVAIGSAPVWAGLFSRARGRRPARRWMAATAVTITGLVAVIAPEATGATDIAVGGLLASAAAGAGFAGYVAATAELEGRCDPFAMLAVVFVLAGVVLLMMPGGTTFGVDGMAALAGHAWLAVGSVAGAYLLFVTGLRRVDVPTATTLTLAEPLTATGLAVLVVGETLTTVGVAGVALLVVGLVATARVGGAPVRVPPRAIGHP